MSYQRPPKRRASQFAAEAIQEISKSNKRKSLDAADTPKASTSAARAPSPQPSTSFAKTPRSTTPSVSAKRSATPSAKVLRPTTPSGKTPRSATPIVKAKKSATPKSPRSANPLVKAKKSKTPPSKRSRTATFSVKSKKSTTPKSPRSAIPLVKAKKTPGSAKTVQIAESSNNTPEASIKAARPSAISKRPATPSAKKSIAKKHQATTTEDAVPTKKPKKEISSTKIVLPKAKASGATSKPMDNASIPNSHVFGKQVADQLDAMSDRSIIAQKLILDVLKQAQAGRLTKLSKITALKAPTQEGKGSKN